MYTKRNNQRNRATRRRLNSTRQSPYRRNMVISTTSSTNSMPGTTEHAYKTQNPKVISIPRLMYTPESIIVDLTYPDTSYNRNNVASTFLSWRYRANSIFDPDPALGSGSVPGYSYYVTGYTAYCVLSIGYDISISNMEASPVDVVAWPSNTDLGLNYAATNEMFGNPHASQNTVSSKGGQDRTRLKGVIDLGSFYGNPYQYCSAFSSSFGANPPSIYLNIGGTSATAFTATNGVDVRVTLTYRTVIFGRKTLIS